MTETQKRIAAIYAAFNSRDVEAALAGMSDGVSWPKASEGGRVQGEAEIRAYWLRQWQTFDPHVEPLEVIEPEPGRAEVRVHQVVRSIAGEPLADSEVWHTYRFNSGLIERMDLGRGDSETAEVPSAAFSRA